MRILHQALRRPCWHDHGQCRVGIVSARWFSHLLLSLWIASLCNYLRRVAVVQPIAHRALIFIYKAPALNVTFCTTLLAEDSKRGIYYNITPMDTENIVFRHVVPRRKISSARCFARSDVAPAVSFSVFATGVFRLVRFSLSPRGVRRAVG